MLLPTLLLALLTPSALLATTTANTGTDAFVYALVKTSQGDILFELDAAAAPETVANFQAYAADGHYDETLFHRVIDGFMIQGGGFGTDETLKPTRAPIHNEADNGLKNTVGTIAMARTGDPHSATCQFFINVADNTFLDFTSKDDGRTWGYCVFGKVIDGMDVVEAITKTKVGPNETLGSSAQQPSAPTEPVVIESIEIVPAKDHAETIAMARAAERRDAEERTARAAKLYAEALAFIASQDDGVDTADGVLSDTGLWSLATVEGKGDHPGQTDTVKVQYTGWLPDGTKFDSSYDRGSPATFRLNGVIKGWTEGVATMRPGGTSWFVIPPALGYGAAGSPPSVPGNATLVFKVELLEVEQPPRYDSFQDAMDFVKSQGVDIDEGSFSPTGLWYVDTVVGSGERPGPTDTVEVHYTGWLTTGKKFDSSKDRGQPIQFALNGVIPGWTEGVGGMMPGGTRWLVIPFDLAYGAAGRPPVIPPRATLIFEVELIALK